MKIILTGHARDMLTERIGAKPAKHQRIAEKAWRSTEEVDPREVANPSFYTDRSAMNGDEAVWRKLFGRIFCFAVSPERALLLSVTPVSNARKPSAWRASDVPRKKLDELINPEARH